MTLGTHAIVGAALASAMPGHPILAFCAGFASHFAIDAIPHFDYPIYSDSIHPRKGAPVRFDRRMLRDALDFSIDAGLGMLISLFFFATPFGMSAVLAGAIGGILPDPLQFAAKCWDTQPLRSLQRFHVWIHSKRRLREEGYVILGIGSQIVFIAAVIATAKLL